MKTSNSNLLYASLGLMILAAIPLSVMLHAGNAAAGPNVTEAPTLPAAHGELAYPSNTAQQPTTSGVVYRANLDARIDALSARHAEHPGGPASTGLAALHFHRFKLIGRVDDLERSLAIVDTRLEAAPGDAGARRTRAHILAGMHRFDEARRDLEHDKESSPSGATEIGLQIELATGNYDAVRSEFEEVSQPTADFYRTALRGNLAMLQGRPDTASVLFFRAQQMYTDSNPYPLAWLHTQQGIALLRTGDCRNAARFFAAAVDRLPDYYLAVEHLAECERQLGQLDSARERYRKVIAQTGQPEFIGALADLERDAGNHQRAERLTARAEREWNRLLQQHGATFSDHAAEFFLERNRPERALALARDIIERRKDVVSLALHARIAFENDLPDEGCRSIAAIERTGLKPPERAELDSLIERCPG